MSHDKYSALSNLSMVCIKDYNSAQPLSLNNVRYSNAGELKHKFEAHQKNMNKYYVYDDGE